MKLMSRAELAAAILVGEAKGYNRQIYWRELDTISNGATVKCRMFMEHHHARGEEVPVHYRCILDLPAYPGAPVLIDMDVDSYNNLPDAKEVTKKGWAAIIAAVA